MKRENTDRQGRERGERWWSLCGGRRWSNYRVVGSIMAEREREREHYRWGGIMEEGERERERERQTDRQTQRQREVKKAVNSWGWWDPITIINMSWVVSQISQNISTHVFELGMGPTLNLS
jgi:hypothetical protein